MNRQPLLLILAMLATPLFAQTPLETAGSNAKEIQTFLDHAEKAHGDFGKRAAEFLVTNMPEEDLRTLKADFLIENLDLAVKAREEFPWAKEVPEEIFFNDVLPYAVFDEPRDPWRADFLEKSRKIVARAKTATEAAQALNREFFNLVNVHYNTGRKRSCQSALESIRQGKATCTGLSIILVEACRSVGVPARAAGIQKWPMKAGNHTWAEIWDGEWFFTGADEYDPAGLNRGWFVDDAKQAVADVPAHAIHATSWKRDGIFFPLAWEQSIPVAAVNVTSRYAKPQTSAEGEVADVSLRVNAADSPDADRRIEADVALVDASGREVARGRTKAGRADRNDMPKFSAKPGANYRWIVTRGDEVREGTLRVDAAGPVTIDLDWDTLAPATPAIQTVRDWLNKLPDERGSAPGGALSREEAQAVRQLLWEDRRARLIEERGDDLRSKNIPHGEYSLRILEKEFGEEPEDGHSLWISLHGGGGTTKEVNDRQWYNQIELYKIDEGYYVAPRSPTNTWNMWHQDHVDPLIDRLIEDYIAIRGVNPNRVYLLGYSAGGDGLYHLGPRLADRLAAASMMAGHPNDSSPLSLRNLPFAILMGGKDAAYNRNTIAAEWGKKLDDLEAADPGGYPHFVRIFPEKGHGMDQEDAIALPWMAKHTRNPWPKKVVWEQGNAPGTRFYWLSLPGQSPKKGDLITADVDGQDIRIETKSVNALTLRLSDELLDLDRPVTVTVNGKRIFEGQVTRNAAAIAESLEERGDRESAATALLPLSW